MSSIYVSEPPTKGKVSLKTTYGPLDIELWPKEAPKAVRNFVQLCLEGYYDNTIFHRIIKSFMVQGGDPTGTGKGGESIYGGTFSDEFHSRLRFNHRGLVACANAGSPNSNGSQFFITLDRCDWLDRKHTIFGKVWPVLSKARLRARISALCEYARLQRVAWEEATRLNEASASVRFPRLCSRRTRAHKRASLQRV